MDEITFFACEEFWKDLRKLRKTVSRKFLECAFDDEEFQKLSCSQKMDCVPILRYVTTALKNKINSLHELPNNHKNANYQPFISINFILWKMRWGVDNHGPAYGLRIMYCVQDKKVVFANIKHKKEVKDSENTFQGETIDRLKFFFAYNYE